MIKLQDFIQQEHIFFDLKSPSKKGVLKDLVKNICSVENIEDKEQDILEQILEREKIESTGIGNSFAIPHCHYEDFSGVKVYVGFPKNPIDFKSIDDTLVRIIFLIIADKQSNDIYLKILSRLMYLLKNAEIREKLFSLTSPNDFMNIIKNSDQQMEYISYHGLKQIISLLEIENEIDIYSKETLILKGKRKGAADLKEDDQYINLKHECDKVIKDIDNRLLQIYKQLKGKYNGDILSKVSRNVCGYCNVQLPIHIIREIERQNQIIQCSTCAKILVLSAER